MNKQHKTRHVWSVHLGLFLFCSPLVCGQDAGLFETPVEPIEEAAALNEPIPDSLEPQTTPSIAPDDVVDAGFVDYAVSPAETILAPETRIEDGEQKITITLDGVSLEDTLRMFAQTARANIIAAPNMLTGLFVSVSLNDVDWIPALRSILEIHNFTLAERTSGSGVFTVQRRGADAPEPTSIKTFFLDYTTAGEVHEPIQKMLTPGKSDLAALQFNSRNALVVRSTEKNMSELEKLIGELDRPGKQILVEAKILELSDEASKQLGIRWDSLEAFGVRAGLGPFTENSNSDDFYQRTANRGIENTSERTSSDSRTQFRDEGRINESSYNATDSSTDFTETRSTVSAPAGSTFLNDQQSVRNNSSLSTRDLSSRANSGSLSDNSSLATTLDRNTSSSSIIEDFTRSIVKSQSAILEMDALQVILSALEKTDGVSVVSNPKLIVTSGSTNAFFSVGEQEPIIRTEIKEGTTDSPGVRITAELDTEIETDFIEGGYLRTGIGLDVVATVKTDDYIEASINPSLRRLLGQKEVAGNSWPIISEKQIRTSFTLRSGQTVAIGGLTDTLDTKETSRVPLLGSIPVFGRLFSHTRDVKRQVETIIFVTLSVADPVNLERASGIPGDARLVHDRLRLMEVLAAATTNNLAEVEAQEDDKTRTRGPRGPRR